MSFMGGSARKMYRRLVGVDEVLKLVDEAVGLRPRRVEEVYVGDAVGRVLAENVHARINVPPYTRALMDGYAVFSRDVEEAWEDRPVRLKVKGGLAAGPAKYVAIERGECLEVATGAVIPYPADAVVPVEYTSREGEWVYVYRRVRHGENLDTLGSDVVEGEVVAWKGDLVTPLTVAALTAAGISRVKVYGRVRVTIIPTGDEIREVGDELRLGELYDSNSHMIYSMLRSLGADVRRTGVVRDSFNDIRAAVEKALVESDVVVTIGGTSAGLEDKTYRVFDLYRPGIILHGVKVKPGRPLVIAAAGEKILVGLPGFPLSCYITASLFLAPMVARLQGLRLDSPPELEARLLAPVKGIAGVRCFVPVILGEDGAAYPLQTHSGRIASLPLIDGFAVIPEDAEYVRPGVNVKVVRFPGLRTYEANILGSHCPVLERLASRLRAEHAVRVVYVGSMGGLQMLRLRLADVAGCHLYDAASGEYNRPFLVKLGIKGVVLIRGYVREQGFVFRRGLDPPVGSLRDVLERGLRFINRNQGSGTRFLVDRLVEEEASRLGVEPDEVKSRIRGYGFEARTHEAVAYAVASGIADVGVAIRYVAERYRLGFTKISDEIFDFAVRAESTRKPPVVKLVSMLQPEHLSGVINGLPGFSLHPDTGKNIATT